MTTSPTTLQQTTTFEAFVVAGHAATQPTTNYNTHLRVCCSVVVVAVSRNVVERQQGKEARS